VHGLAVECFGLAMAAFATWLGGLGSWWLSRLDDYPEGGSHDMRGRPRATRGRPRNQI
jgi:hypothetical protein